MQTPALYIFFGLIASGKSTLADLFSQTHDLPCYNTDRVRKELAGLAATERRPDGMGQGIYTPAFTRKTYQALLDLAQRDINQGRNGVILDGSYARLADRQQVIDLADQLELSAWFILCTCSDDEVKRRLALRAEDPKAVSDGRWDIFVLQKERFEYPSELSSSRFLELSTEDPPRQLLTQIDRFIANGA